jgi:hypothetical protein
VINPTDQSFPSSMPSYSFWATLMVFFAENLKALDASCCNLLVVKGGRAERLSSFFSSFSTANAAFLISAAS